MFRKMRARLRGGRRRCPLCFDDLTASAELQACDACGTSYHPACFAELGGCSTAGCARARLAPGVTAAPAPPQVQAIAQVDDHDAIALHAFAGALLGVLVAYVVGWVPTSLGLAVGLAAGCAFLGSVACVLIKDLLGRAAAARSFGAALGLALGTLLALIVAVVAFWMFWDADPPIGLRSPLLVELPALIALACGALGAWLGRPDEPPGAESKKRP